MTYAEFQTYVLASLWRQNDADLTANLSTLILQANNELDVLTRDWQRRMKTVVIAPEAEDFDLTTNVPDLQAVQAVIDNNSDGIYQSSEKEFMQVPLSEIYRKRTTTQSARLLPIYCVDRSDSTRFLRFVAPFSASSPGDLTMVYRIGIPALDTGEGADPAQTSWMLSEHLNLYLYTVFKHCAIFLREDERVQLYQGLQTEAFAAADMDDKHNLQFGGTPLKMRSHRAVP